MSRCFPYPSPGNLKQGLFESIKLERERVLPKSELKSHKKRDKKKDKKGKDETQYLPKKFKKLDYVLKLDEDQLEKSDLTEEHDPPVCYISDGSQNSHKRKRESVSHSEWRVDGNKLKIRFTFKKSCGLDALTSKESACSSSGRPESNLEASSLTSVASAPELKLRLQDDRSVHVHPSEPSCSGALLPQEKLWHNGERKASSGTFAKHSKIPKAVVQYKTLIEDWLPPLLLPELNDYENGDDWLLPKKQLCKPAPNRLDDHVLCSDSISWPRAHYIPEAEIYALPCTVPF